MNLVALGIAGSWVGSSPIHADSRGHFREWFKGVDILEKTGIDFDPQQANISFNHSGVIRGLHYSLSPEKQFKWITCVTGKIIDIVVDLRPKSETYKRVEYIELTPENGKAVLIGAGLGHGFISLHNDTVVSYLLSSPYAPEFEYEINPFDEELDIKWDFEMIDGRAYVMSEKDAQAPSLNHRKINGELPF
jgi:dTDP-4-dehydrorhamnose 3,5-epimerase